MRTGIALACLPLLCALAGCGGATMEHQARSGSSVRIAPATGPARAARGAHGSRPPHLTLSHCPPGRPACRTTKGRIVYIEHVDPDGDGDAHFVIVDPQGISLPGITAIDVRRGLRPEPLPSIGDRVSAAGPVQAGSYGQSQIHALELHVAGE
jgi:hypothetical protein